MPTLLLRLVAPLQSWGTSSRFAERDTQLEPSKSGVLGLVCAALGRERHEPIEDLARLRFGVRIDREGKVWRDYQTILPPYRKASGALEKKCAVESFRYYLCDAAFLVGLEGEDRSLLQGIHSALRAPRWPLYLGRKSCPPGECVWMKDALRDEPLREALERWPPLVKVAPGAKVRLLLEDPKAGSLRFDQPLGPFSTRRFGARYVSTELITLPAYTEAGHV